MWQPVFRLNKRKHIGHEQLQTNQFQTYPFFDDFIAAAAAAFVAVFIFNTLTSINER